MKNLANDPDCDREIERELTRCGIEIIRGERARGEVRASITGKLGAFTFRRAWYYWVVDGPMPLELARKIYAHPVGKTDIRVDGHCGCPSPDDPPWAAHYAADGRRLAFDRGGEEPRQFDDMIAKGFIKQSDKDQYIFVPDPAAVAVKSFIESYHVDSELGLYVLAHAIRCLTVTTQPPLPKQDSPPVGSASDSDTAETLPVELASGSGLNARQGGGDSTQELLDDVYRPPKDDSPRSAAYRHYLNVDGVGFALDRGHAFLAGYDAASKPPQAERVDDLSELEFYRAEALLLNRVREALMREGLDRAHPGPVEAIGELIAEIRRLRHALESQTFAYPSVSGCSKCWTQPPKFLDGQCQHCGAGGK